VDAEHLQKAADPEGNKLYHGQRQGVTFAMADALCWLLASRCQILDVLELEARGPDDAVAAEGLAGHRAVLHPTCAMCRRRGRAGEVSRICAELVFGYNRHPAWDERDTKSLLLRGNWMSTKTMPGIRPLPSMFSMRTESSDRRRVRARAVRGASEFLRLQNKLACA
jgi:hypothetical protein